MNIDPALTDRVLAHVHGAEYRPGKPKQIAESLELDADGYREVRRIVKQLVVEGRLFYGGNHLVLPASTSAADAETLRGTFRRAVGGGFGFVRPTGRIGNADSDVPDDIFVPPGSTAGAMEGDTVDVKISPGRRGGIEGVVVSIVDRGRRQYAATYLAKTDATGGPGVILDGVPFDQPIGIGDIRGLPLENKDKVFVELVEFPGEDGRGGQAVILERLGSSNNPAIDTLTVMRQYGLPDEFPEAVLNDARKQADLFDEENFSPQRLDLTNLLTVTIDPYDARDFDDAISLQREEGRWRLWVHIADVTAFVPPGGPLDADAKNRATSVYLPDRVVPMLPEIISNHLASLQPGKNRLVKTVEIEILDDLTITHTQVHNAVIHSDRRFNYEEIDQFLASPGDYRQIWGDEVCDLVTQMHTLAMKMRRRRFKRGSISMNMPEVKLKLDRSGKVKGAYQTENTESHQIIEEFMLAANQAVATWLDDLELHFLHRVHPAPDRRKLRQLSMFVKDLRLGIENVESRFEIQAVLDKVADTPLENAVNFAVLKSMSKAVYAPNREEHYALDMQHYCHFTSPIRRYPDLSVHRLIGRLIEGVKTPDDSFAELVKLGHHCSDRERNAAQAERELIELKLLHFLKKKVGETLQAVVSRVFPDGLHARCIKLPVDGYVPVGTLPADQYRFERRGQMLIGFRDGNRFRLGDRLTVQIDRVDLIDRQLHLKVLKNHNSDKRDGEKLAGSPKKSDYKTKRKTDRRDKRKKKNK